MTLFQDIPKLDILPGAESTTSYKNWGNDYSPINAYRLHDSSQAAFDAVFGAPTAADLQRYNQEVVPAPERGEFVRNEGDVVRVWDRHIAGPVKEYWKVIQANESSPLVYSPFPGIVDTQFVLYMTQYYQLTFVEHKTPGVIAPSWKAKGLQSSPTLRLGRELRGYAYGYNCPQGGCYDGKNLMIFNFPAITRDDIKTSVPDIFVINGVELTPPGGIYLRYALDRLIEIGVRRAMASLAPLVQIGTWERRFEWSNGTPYWYNNSSQTTSRTVTGIERRYDELANRWAWYNNEGKFYDWCAAAYF